MLTKRAKTHGFVLAVMAIVLIAPNIAKAQVVTDGLISFWSFDRNTTQGQIVNDSWGANHGEVQGNLNAVEGKVNEALEFSGVGDHILVPNDESLKIENEISIMAWVIWAGTPSTIICKRDPTNYQFTLFPPPHNIQLCTGNACKYAPEVLEADRWMHVVVIRSGDKISYYIDGEFAGGLDEPAGWSVSDASVRIGTNGPEGGNQHFKGIIDELLIYNRALSRDEVTHNRDANGLAVAPAGKLATTWSGIKALSLSDM